MSDNKHVLIIIEETNRNKTRYLVVPDDLVIDSITDKLEEFHGKTHQINSKEKAQKFKELHFQLSMFEGYETTLDKPIREPIDHVYLIKFY